MANGWLIEIPIAKITTMRLNIHGEAAGRDSIRPATEYRAGLIRSLAR